MLIADTFTDTNGTALASHTGEKGGAFTKHADSTPAPTIQGNGVVSSTSGAGWGYYASTPSGVNQEVCGVFVFGANATNRPGICARMETAATTYYDVRYDGPAGKFELYKTVAGSETALGEFSFTPAVGYPAFVILNCTDAVKQVFVNGDLVIESTDNAITATGRIGVRVEGNDTAGIKLDRVWASNGYSGSIDSFNNSVDQAVPETRSGALRARWVYGVGSYLYITQSASWDLGPAPVATLPGGRLRSGNQYTGYYYISAVPASADYDVATVVAKRALSAPSQTALAGPVGRMATTGSPPNAYAIAYDSTNQWWALYRFMDGVSTVLATWAETNVSGAVGHALLEMSGTTLKMWIDGVERASVVDANITTAGRAGVWVRAGTTSAMHDRVSIAVFHYSGSVTDPSGPPAPTLSSATAKIAACTLAWTAVTDVGSAGLKGYRTEYRLTGGTGPWTMLDTVFTTLTGTVWGLPGGSSLDFRVRGEDNVGNLSVPSNVIAATPTSAPAQPAGYNEIAGTHSGTVTVGEASITGDPAEKSVDYNTGKTTFPDDPAFDVGATCTLRAVVRPASVPSAGTRRAIIDRAAAYSLKMNGSSLEGTVIIGTVAKTATASSVFSANVTVDVAMTYDGANVQLWKAGVAVGAAVPATGSVDVASSDITIGDIAAGGQAFVGKMAGGSGSPVVLAEALRSDRLVEDARSQP